MSAADWWERIREAAIPGGSSEPEPGSAAMTDSEIEAESGAIDATRHRAAADAGIRSMHARTWSLVGLGLAAAAAVGFVAYAVMKRGKK
jgi:hypothetical protein